MSATEPKLERLTSDLAVMHYPLEVLGLDIRRNVTVIRLSSGELVIHSTAPFGRTARQDIEAFGDPAWLVEGMLRHDTFSEQGHAAFSDLPFLAPAGFEKKVSFPVQSLLPPPDSWKDELSVLKIEGAPKFGEHVFFHHSSGTLIVCDLLFHFPEVRSFWERCLLTPTLGYDPTPGFSRLLKLTIRDEKAFSQSLEEILAWPIERIIPGHGDVLHMNAKSRARTLFKKNDLLGK